MCLSFQFQKHLSLGRGGMILLDDEKAAFDLKKLSYDGREPNQPWREQNIKSMGYHYYMTPETAAEGLKKLPQAKKEFPKSLEMGRLARPEIYGCLNEKSTNYRHIWSRWELSG